MAEFNPTVGEVAPNYTGRSQGGGADTSFETLFSGIGQALGQGVQTADTFVQNKIEDDSRYAFDSLNQEFGFDAGDYGEDGGANAIPSEILQSGDGLNRLARAQAQGKVTPEYYYQRLASTMKGLRAKYPGYEKQVDDILAKVTGTRPANAFRDALFANINQAQAAAADSQAQFDRWATSEGNIGYVSTMYPDIFTNPERYASPEAQAKVMTAIGQRKGAVDIATDTEKLNNADKSVSGPQVSKWASSVVNTHIFGAVQQAGVGEGGSNILSSAMADNVISPDEGAAIQTYLARVKMQARQDVLNRWSREGFARNFSQAEMNNYIDEALAGVTEIEQYIQQGNVQQATVVAQRLKVQQDMDNEALYQAAPELRTAAAIRGISEPGAAQIVDEVIAAKGGGTQFLDWSNQVIMRDIAGASVDGRVSLSRKMEIINSAPGKTAQEKQTILGQSLDTELSAITSGKLAPEKIGAYVKQNYNDDIDTLFNAVDDSTVGKGGSQRLKLFQKMFDPKVTKAIVDSGDQEAFRMYMGAALDKATQVPEFRRTAADLSEQLDYSKYARVEYDPERNRLIIKTNPDAFRGENALGAMGQIALRNSVEKASQAFNNTLNTIVPIIEASGSDELEGVKQFAKTLALDLGTDGQGFYKYLSDNINEVGVETDTEGQGEALSPSEEGAPPEFTDPTLGPSGERLGESQGIEPINYAPAQGSTPALDAIDAVTNWEEIPVEQTSQLPGGDISFLFEDSKSLKDAASGPYTGDTSQFINKTNPLEIAQSFNGLNERQHAQVISSFIKQAAGQNINPAVTAWCAAFVNGVLGASGSKGTGKLNARSFLNWGNPVTTPKKGDVVVFQRGNSGWQGHVGFYVDQEVRDGKPYIKVLGGNQSNSVKESWYPADRLLGIRRAS